MTGELDTESIERANAEAARSAVERLRPAIEAGNGNALLTAIQVIAANGGTFPLWLAAATFQTIDKYKNHESATLDEAFGVKRPPRYRQAKARELETVARDAIADIVSLRMLGLPVDSGMFEAVGTLYAAGKTKVSEWYYGDPASVKQAERVCAWVGPQMTPELSRVAESLGYRGDAYEYVGARPSIGYPETHGPKGIYRKRGP